MTARPPIICLGSIVADLIARPVSALPAPGQQALVDSLQLVAGGSAATTAAALAHLGVPVALVARAGADALGDFVLADLARAGVATTAVQRDAQTGTSCTLSLVDPDGERRFIHYIGANANLDPQDVDWSLLAGASFLHVAGALVLPALDGAPLAGILARARAAGVSTSLDIIWDATGRWMSRLAPCLPYVDYFLPNLVEGQALTGRERPTAVAEALHAAGVGTVVLKLGAAGCLLAPAGQAGLHVPGISVPVVDTTGAGDAFAAGFLAGLWYGGSLQEAARLGNATGALRVTGPGGPLELRSLDESRQ